MEPGTMHGFTHNKNSAVAVKTDHCSYPSNSKVSDHDAN